MVNNSEVVITRKEIFVVVVGALLFTSTVKHLRSCWDGQLT